MDRGLSSQKSSEIRKVRKYLKGRGTNILLNMGGLQCVLKIDLLRWEFICFSEYGRDYFYVYMLYSVMD